MKAIRILLITLGLAALALTGFSQSGRSLSVESSIGVCEYSLNGTDWKPLLVGDLVPESATVRVSGKDDILELGFPDGTIVKVFGKTSVQVKAIMKPNEAKKNENVLSLLFGSAFSTVKKSPNQDFRIETQTGVAAVRGTRFGVNFTPGRGGDVVVTDGEVDMIDPTGNQPPMRVGAGFMGGLPPVVGQPFRPVQAATPEALSQFDENGRGRGRDNTNNNGRGNDSSSSESSAPASSSAGSGSGGVTTPVVPGLPGGSSAPASGGGAAPAPGAPGASAGSSSCNNDGFNWAIASEAIDGLLWNKVLLSPTFKFGELSFGLYLTVYFQNLDDILAPVRWYNYDEWNFGFNTNNADFDVMDLVHDVMLKLRFLEYKSKTFEFGIGSLPAMSIGHGSLVNAYANDLFFPAERVIGLKLGWDFGSGGIEAMVGDVYFPHLSGLRAFWRPLYGGGTNKAFLLGDLAVGISGFYDSDPLFAGGSNKVFGYALDLDLPILDILGLVKVNLYTDVATMGWITPSESVWYKGLGFFAGAKGNILFINYRAEYRYLNNGFMPNYVDKFYDVNRVANFSKLTSADNTNSFNGFLIEAGQSFSNIGGVTLSYQEYFGPTTWPNPGYESNHNNFLHVEAFVDKCLFKKFYGSISYDRANFNYDVFFSGFIGEGVIITTKGYYEVSAGAYVGINFKKFYEINPSGVLEEKTTLAFETQLGL